MSDVETEVAALSGHWAYAPVRAAWSAAHDRARVASLLDGLREPGMTALRCRFRHLLDPGRPEVAEGVLTTDDETWHRIVELETRADVHLRDGDADARSTAEELLTLEYQPAHRVVTVNALLALADLARHVDDREHAASLFEAAVDTARADGYRFGEMRGLVSLGYLALTMSATAATEHFARARLLADGMGERLYAANATLGIAECWQRARAWSRAAQHAEDALRTFTAIRSPIGVGNAATRLADILIHTPGGDDDRVEALLRQAADAYGNTNPIGRIGVLDYLGDHAQRRGDIRAAVEHHRSAYALSERHKYPRGKANSLAGLAEAGRVAGTWEVAARLGRSALAAFRDLGDPLGEANALEGLAVCADVTGAGAEALELRLGGVRTIERMRADLRRRDWQAEYRSRFEGTYRRAARSALDAGDRGALLWLLECLAGRRLAGLVGQGGPAGSQPDTPEWADKRAKATARIAAMSAAGGTSALDLLSAMYLPPPDELDVLVAALPPDCDTVVVEVGLLGEDTVTWAHVDPDHRIGTGSVGVPGLGDLLTAVSGETAQGLTLPDLEPLRASLPHQLVDRIHEGEVRRVLVVPVGRALAVPWTAVPVADGVLGESAEVVVCPSLTVQRALRERHRAPWPASPTVGVWRDPDLIAHEVTSVDGVEVEAVGSGAAAAAGILDASHDVVVVAVHGRKDGETTSLVLDDQTRLTVADCLDARPPRGAALIACWAGYVDTSFADTEPATLATVLLAAGSEWVLATTAELADATIATRFVRQVLDGAVRAKPAPALKDAVRALLAKPTRRSGLIKYWAPLQVFGTFPSLEDPGCAGDGAEVL